MLLLKMGPEVPSRARRALPALRRSENEDGRRPSECSRTVNNCTILYVVYCNILCYTVLYCYAIYCKMRYCNLLYEKFGWPTAILFLTPAEGWKGPSGPAGDLWPHLK